MTRIIIWVGLVLFLCSAVRSEADEVVVGAQFPLSGPMASYSGPSPGRHGNRPAAAQRTDRYSTCMFGSA